MRLLIVEDEPELAGQLKDAMTQVGYAVDLAADGEDAWHLGETEPYDAVVLDLGLPALDGVQVLERWRAAGRDMPVLILTARDRWSDKVAGIDAFVGRLRKKLGSELIETVRGLGYRLSDPRAEA